MTPIAFLTMDSLEGFVTYDSLTYAPLAARGWQVEAVSWRREDVDWSRFAAVVIRTPWDYQRAPAQFMAVLETISRATRLANPLPLVRWNLDKAYLRDLAARGVATVPTRWGYGLTPEALRHAYDAFATDTLVVKPTVGANADDTFRLHAGADVSEVVRTFAARPFMAQPFVPAVAAEGEFSLFYFGGAYSHAILKTPRAGDFRVQEEHGGHIRACRPEPALRRAADAVAAALPAGTLYARVDLVRLPGGAFAVMELELVEPSLYFSYDDEAPARFADAFERWMRG